MSLHRSLTRFGEGVVKAAVPTGGATLLAILKGAGIVALHAVAAPVVLGGAAVVAVGAAGYVIYKAVEDKPAASGVDGDNPDEAK